MRGLAKVEEQCLLTAAVQNMKAVLDLCVNTIRYGTQEYITDCPTREKGVYLGDLMISGRAQAILAGDTSFLKNAVESFLPTMGICPGLITTSCCGTSR